MTDYTNHPDGVFDPNKPILGSTHLEARDNLISAMTGGDNAPRLALKSVERLVAGDSVRTQVSGAGVGFDGNYVAALDWDFMQIGVVRCTLTRQGGTILGYRVSRTRQGVTTVVATGAAGTSFVADVPVVPFDRIALETTGTGLSPVPTVNAKLSIGSGNLWAGVSANVEGNDVS